MTAEMNDLFVFLRFATELRWPQGGPTPYGYLLQAVGVAVELKRGVITFFISTLAVAIRQAKL